MMEVLLGNAAPTDSERLALGPQPIEFGLDPTVEDIKHGLMVAHQLPEAFDQSSQAAHMM